MRVYVNIGSNLGDRRAMLQAALKAIDERFTLLAVSDIVESEPWGFDSPNAFLNVCAAFDTTLSPLPLLDALQEIERAISPASHRTPAGLYADRAIDIDIVYIPGMTIDHPRLKVPHPHLGDRDFFSRPLAQLLERQPEPPHASDHSDNSDNTIHQKSIS